MPEWGPATTDTSELVWHVPPDQRQLSDLVVKPLPPAKVCKRRANPAEMSDDDILQPCCALLSAECPSASVFVEHMFACTPAAEFRVVEPWSQAQAICMQNT